MLQKVHSYLMFLKCETLLLFMVLNDSKLNILEGFGLGKKIKLKIFDDVALSCRMV